MKPTDTDCIALCLEAFIYGLYSGIFAMHFQHQSTHKMKNILFYPLCGLHVLSGVVVVTDTITSILQPSSALKALDLRCLYFLQGTVTGCCDFIAQCILIYRCWIVWRRDIRVVVIPSVLAFAFLAAWLASTGSLLIGPGPQIVAPAWEYTLILTALVLSLTVNALVTGLIVFSIFKVFKEINFVLEEQAPARNTNKLRPIMFILIESAVALFSIQLTRIVVGLVPKYNPSGALTIIVYIHQMLNGITPTIILVRVSMGLSFHDEESMEDAVGSLCFALDNPNSNPETGTSGSISPTRYWRESTDIDIDIVER